MKWLLMIPVIIWLCLQGSEGCVLGRMRLAAIIYRQRQLMH